MVSFVQDLRYASRTLLKSPGFAMVAILTLALGIGANVATFSVVYGVLLRPLPFPHPEQLVRIFDDLRGPNEQDVGMSAPELWDLQDRSGVFQEISAVAPSNSAVGGGDRTVRAESLVTSPDYFDIAGSEAGDGPRVHAAGCRAGISGAGGDQRRILAAAIMVRTRTSSGGKCRLDSDLYTIVGVMPPGFRHPGRTLDTDVEVWPADRIQRAAISCSGGSHAAIHSGGDWAIEARDDGGAGAIAARCLCGAAQRGSIRPSIPPLRSGRCGWWR